MDLPSFGGDGTEAYVDYTRAPMAMAMADNASGELPPVGTAPAGVPDAYQSVQGEVLPPAAITPEYAAAAREALAAEQKAAERQKQLANNPLHRGLGILGGIIGAPLNFVGAALGGGDMTEVTAPFRPGQTAQQRYDAVMGDIATRRLNLEKVIAATNYTNTQIAGKLTEDRAKLIGDVHSNLANLAMNASAAAQADPSVDPKLLYLEGLLGQMDNPVYGPIIKELGLNARPWTPNLARELATSKDDVTRLDAMGKPKEVLGSEWKMDRLAAARMVYPNLSVEQLDNPEILSSPAVTAQYNNNVAARAGQVAKSSASGRRAGAPPVGAKPKVNVSGMSSGDLLKMGGL